MNDKAKNIISNILGLLITGASVTAYLLSKIELTQFGIVFLVGLSLFLFKADKTKEWLNKFLNKKLNK